MATLDGLRECVTLRGLDGTIASRDQVTTQSRQAWVAWFLRRSNLPLGQISGAIPSWGNQDQTLNVL
jgi:hypothetical protein